MIFEYLKINYFIILPTKDCDLDNDQSFFQRFSRRIFEVNPLLAFLEYAPNNIYELFCTRENLIKSRVCNPSLSINFIDDKSINQDRHKIKSKFTVVMYLENKTENHEKFTSYFDQKPIVISVKLTRKGNIICDYNHDRLNAELKLIAEKELQISQNSKERDLIKLLQEIKINKNTSSNKNITSYAHRVFDPLSLVLYELGYDVTLEELDLVDNAEHYTNKMIPLVSAIKQERMNLNINSDEFSNDVVVYCPSVCNYLYDFKSDYWETIKKKRGMTEKNWKILKSMIKIKNFSTATIKIKDEDKISLYEDNDIAPFIVDRQRELNLFTILMSIFAKSQLVPCVRLPHSIMLHQETLGQISSMISSGNNRLKINNKLIAYSKDIRENIGKTFINSVFTESKIVAVCDIPIEWVSINHIPIMFSHEISRVPTTPGNLLQTLLTSYPRTYLTYKKICDILIIKSYKDNDSIKDVLGNAIKFKMELSGLPNLNIVWKDVSTRKELIEVINSFNGGITIFDCHGGHGGIKENAYLKVGDDAIDVWELSKHCKTSPIVILSSCSTHPINGSHASVANGLFVCGSLSVVGTYASVDAVHSSVMITRILFRISSYLKIVLDRTGSVTWRKLMSGFFRLSYINDILRDMQNNKHITSDASNDIEIKTAMAINYYKKDWLDIFIGNLSEVIGKPIDEVKNLIDSKYQFVETMLYTQLGRPENIIIYDDSKS